MMAISVTSVPFLQAGRSSERPHTVSKLKENTVLTPIQKEKILGENARKPLKGG
jgi:hypothetical protein